MSRCILAAALSLALLASDCAELHRCNADLVKHPARRWFQIALVISDDGRVSFNGRFRNYILGLALYCPG